MLRETLRMLTIILGISLVGALAGLLVGNRFLLSVATDEACFALNSGTRLKYLDTAKEAAVIQAVAAAPELFAKTKEIMQRVKPGCH